MVNLSCLVGYAQQMYNTFRPAGGTVIASHQGRCSPYRICCAHTSHSERVENEDILFSFEQYLLVIFLFSFACFVALN